ncbi:MAG TPA: secondary thiamine-phosphate synthase enzyme YjbQ [Thermoanaerobaculia bacterium]|nr:secondary thiamine-phosphate synthase enzyme YjbQ [Thermoanaerobaculia bacterium]
MEPKRFSRLSIPTTDGTDIVDLTAEVEAFVAASGVTEGLLVVFVPGSTAGVTTIEFESGAVEDLRQAIERLAPRGADYAHDRRWGDGNGYAHVRAALLGPSLTVPVSGGRPLLGTWQQIVLCDFDNRPRRREILLRIVSGGA